MQTELENWKMKGSYFRYNGNNIFYISEGQGNTLVIFHGYPYNSFDFKDVWESLTKKYRVVIPDMLGMGFSDKPANYPYSFDDHANMYSRLLNELHITELIILAHDLGNSVVQELIARNEEGKNAFKINGIAFLNGGLFTDVYKPRFLQILLSKSPRVIGKLVSKVMSKKSVGKATAEVFGPNTKPDENLLQNFWDILNYNGGKSIAWLIGRLVFQKEEHQHRWISAMKQTKIPMCFINGPADPNSGEHMAQRYRELIPAPLVIFLSNDIGHWPQIEAPKEVLEAFEEFVGSNTFS